MPQLDAKPEYQAERVTGKFRRQVTDITEDVKIVNGANGERKIITRKMAQRWEEFSDGYMIYFPQGHSIFVAADDEEQLQRIGVLNDPRLVDMESGEIIPENYALTPKEIVERKTRNRPRPTTGGIAEALEG
jgi:hypothetical protein